MKNYVYAGIVITLLLLGGLFTVKISEHDVSVHTIPVNGCDKGLDVIVHEDFLKIKCGWWTVFQSREYLGYWRTYGVNKKTGEDAWWVQNNRKKSLIDLEVIDESPSHFIIKKTIPYYKGSSGTDGELVVEYVFTPEKIKWSYNFTTTNNAIHRIRLVVDKDRTSKYGYDFLPDDDLYYDMVDDEYYYGNVKGNLFIDPTITITPYSLPGGYYFENFNDSTTRNIPDTNVSILVDTVTTGDTAYDNCDDSAVNTALWNVTGTGGAGEWAENTERLYGDSTVTTTSTRNLILETKLPYGNFYNWTNVRFNWSSNAVLNEENNNAVCEIRLQMWNNSDYINLESDTSSGVGQQTCTISGEYNFTFDKENEEVRVWKDGTEAGGSPFDLSSISDGNNSIWRIRFFVEGHNDHDGAAGHLDNDMYYLHINDTVENATYQYLSSVYNLSQYVTNFTADIDDNGGDNATYYYSMNNSTWYTFTDNTNNWIPDDIDTDSTTLYWKVLLNNSREIYSINFSFDKFFYVDAVNVTPIDPHKSDTIYCNYTWYNSTNGTGNDNTNISWYVNSTYIKSGVNWINSSNFTQEDDVYCDVRPSNGTLLGVSISSNSVEINYTVATNLSIEGYNISKKWESGTTPLMVGKVYDSDDGTLLNEQTICISIGLHDYGLNVSCVTASSINYNFTIPYVEETKLNVFTPSSTYSECYQETANISTACGGLANGTYYSNITNFPEKSYDGGYGTSSSTTLNDTWTEVNYSKINNSVGLKIMFRDGTLPFGQVYNVSVTDDCWDAYDNIARIRGGFKLTNNVTVDCYNGTDWIVLSNRTTTGFYEEGAYFNVSNSTTTQSFINSQTVIGNNTFNFSMYNWSELINASFDINGSGNPQDIFIDIANDGSQDLVLRGSIIGDSLIESRYSDDNVTKEWQFFNSRYSTKYINLSNQVSVQENITVDINASASNPEGIDFEEYWADTRSWNDTGNETGAAPTWMFDDITTSVSGRWNFDESGGATAEHSVTNENVYTSSAAAVSCGSGGQSISESAFFNSNDLDMLDDNKRWDFDYSCSASATGSNVGDTSGNGNGRCNIYLTNSITGGGSSEQLLSCWCSSGSCYDDCPVDCSGHSTYCSGSTSGVLSLRQKTNGDIEVYEDGSLFKTVTPPSGDTLEIKTYTSASASCTGSIGASGSASSTGAINDIEQGGFGANYSEAGDTITLGTYELISDIILNTSNQSDSSLHMQNALATYTTHEPSGCDLRFYLRTNYSDDTAWQEFTSGLITDFNKAGSNLSFKINMSVTSTDDLLNCALSELQILVSTDYVSNISIYFGESNVPSYSYTDGDLNETNTPITISINYTDVNSYFSDEACTDTGVTCLIPMKIETASGTTGVLDVYNITINQTLNDVPFNVSNITVELATHTGDPLTKHNITNYINNSNGTVTLSDLAIRYLGNGNITINATVWNQTGSVIHDSIDMIIRYTPFTLAFTQPRIEDLFFNPWSNNILNMSPYGQIIGRHYNRSIQNVTNDAYIHNMDLYLSTNVTDAWWNTSRGTNYTQLYIMNQTDKNTDVNITLNSTRQAFIQNTTNSTTTSIYMLLDLYNITSTPYFDWWNWWESYCSDSGDGYGACVVIS